MAAAWHHGRPLRRPLLIVLSACIALLLAALLSAGAHARAAACTPGHTKVDGKKAERFCGPATVALHMGKFWVRLTGGSCASTSNFFTVNVGTAVVAPNQKVPYFGLTVGQFPGAPKDRKPVGEDGVYRKGVVVIRWHGGAWDINGWVRITLTGHLSSGTFAGSTTAYPHSKVSGSFKC